MIGQSRSIILIAQLLAIRVLHYQDIPIKVRLLVDCILIDFILLLLP